MNGVRRRLWRADWTWRLRQMTWLLFALWFVGAGVLGAVAYAIDPRVVGWVVLAWFLGLLAFVVTMTVLNARLRRRWAEVVAEMGWTTTASAPDLAARWPFPPFSADPSPEVVDVTSGLYRGRRFWTGMYRYTAGRHRLGFAFLDLEIDRPLPPVQVAPESLTRLVAPAMRPLDLHLQNAEFNDRFRLVRGESALVHAMLHPRVMELMLSVQPFGFVSCGERFVVLTPGFRNASTVLAQMDAACDLLDLIPEQLWDAGGRWTAQPQP